MLIAYCCSSERYIPMLLRRVLVAFCVQHFQGVNELLARVTWTNDSIDISPFSGHVRIREAFSKFFDFLAALAFQNFRALGFGVAHLRGTLQLPLVNDIHGSFRTHYGNFGGRPSVVHVSANVLR